MVIMREKLKHIEAYEYYFLLGGLVPVRNKKEACKHVKRGSNFYKQLYSLCGKRSLLKVARRFNVSRRAVNNWCKAFNWKERVRKRDLEINRKVNIRLQKLVEKCP